jgi:hypothetical protein
MTRRLWRRGASSWIADDAAESDRRLLLQARKQSNPSSRGGDRTMTPSVNASVDILQSRLASHGAPGTRKNHGRNPSEFGRSGPERRASQRLEASYERLATLIALASDCVKGPYLSSSACGGRGSPFASPPSGWHLSAAEKDLMLLWRMRPAPDVDDEAR